MHNTHSKEADNSIEKQNQLLLELEMDDEVKEIINFPEKYLDTFLDVTVIKPTNNKEYTTEKKVMSSNQVKQFIASMNLNQLHDILPSNNDQISAGDSCKKPHNCPLSNKNECSSPSALGDHLPKSSSKQETILKLKKEEIQQVYNAPRTYQDINSYFDCKYHKTSNNEKEDSPCICRNCAIVGVVTDSQKRPFITEPLKNPETSNLRNSANKECNRKRSRDGEHQQCQNYFKHLSDKIRTLEERIAAQEQKAVPKEYFKKIVTKLVTHIGKVAANGTQQIKIETSPPPPAPHQSKQYSVNKINRFDHLPNQKFIVNPLIVENDEHFKEKVESNKEVLNSTSLWKWGEDILKPGIDLKNKIISVMEITLNNLKRSKEKPKEDELKHFINDFSNNLYKTVNEGKISGKKQSSDQTATVDFRERIVRHKDINRKLGVVEEPLSVTYVNSHILKWQETQTTFKFDSSDKESVKSVVDNKKTQDINKLEFYKTIKNTKEEDKLRLWRSIWNQANKNGHCKANKVTVQIPDKKNPKNRPIEVEYSLAELQYLLVGNKVGRR